MRKLKITLADSNQYTFTTLTRRQVGAVQTAQKNRKTWKRAQELSQKEDEEGLSIEETVEAEECEKIEEAAVYDMICMSLAKAHPEFTLTAGENKGDKKTNEGIIEKLHDLVDMQDIRIVSGFALSGTVDLEEEGETKLGDIVLS